MPTTCAVVGCYNRHCKDSLISFIVFQQIVRDGVDGLVLFPGKMRMEFHGNQEKEIILKKKSDLPNNLYYVSSVYPAIIAKKSSDVTNVGSLACFGTQRHSATTEMERLANEKEEEESFLFVQQTLEAFKSDHGSYCKSGTRLLSKLLSVNLVG